jgi:hypothetical protein
MRGCTYFRWCFRRDSRKYIHLILFIIFYWLNAEAIQKKSLEIVSLNYLYLLQYYSYLNTHKKIANWLLCYVVRRIC